jgi:hypothetical protein
MFISQQSIMKNHLTTHSNEIYRKVSPAEAGVQNKCQEHRAPDLLLTKRPPDDNNDIEK